RVAEESSGQQRENGAQKQRGGRLVEPFVFALFPGVLRCGGGGCRGREIGFFGHELSLEKVLPACDARRLTSLAPRSKIPRSQKPSLRRLRKAGISFFHVIGTHQS